MIRAKWREPEILKPPFYHNDRHACLAGDLVNAADHRTKVVATNTPCDNANRRQLRLHGSLLWECGAACLKEALAEPSVWLMCYVPLPALRLRGLCAPARPARRAF